MIRRPKIALACLGLALLSLSLATGRGDAAPACTTTFTGGGGTTAWGTAANWDNGLPGASSHACIPSGKTAVHSTGTDAVLSIQVAGSLTISGGTLNLTDTGNDSNAASLT